MLETQGHVWGRELGSTSAVWHHTCLSWRHGSAGMVTLQTVLYVNTCTAAKHPGDSSFQKARNFNTASLINLIQTLACYRECLSRGESLSFITT